MYEVLSSFADVPCGLAELLDMPGGVASNGFYLCVGDCQAFEPPSPVQAEEPGRPRKRPEAGPGPPDGSPRGKRPRGEGAGSEAAGASALRGTTSLKLPPLPRKLVPMEERQLLYEMVAADDRVRGPGGLIDMCAAVGVYSNTYPLTVVGEFYKKNPRYRAGHVADHQRGPEGRYGDRDVLKGMRQFLSNTVYSRDLKRRALGRQPPPPRERPPGAARARGGLARLRAEVSELRERVMEMERALERFSDGSPAAGSPADVARDVQRER